MDKSERALAKFYDGICRSHSNGLMLAQKILRDGYYWPTMQEDFVCYAKSYKKYQLLGNFIHALGHELIPSIIH